MRVAAHHERAHGEHARRKQPSAHCRPCFPLVPTVAAAPSLVQAQNRGMIPLLVMAGHSRPKDGVASLAYVPAIHVFLPATEPRLAEPPNRRPAPVGLAHGDRADRRHAKGRYLPPDSDRSRSKGARLVQGAMRSARLHRDRRRHGQHVRAPAGQEPGASADRHGLASRHPADRRQVRRRAWRSRRARSAAHAARDGLRDQCSRSRSSTGPTKKARALRRRCWPRASLPACSRATTPMRGRTATAKPSATNWRASAIAATEKAGARKFSAMFELHIEQGPILEAEGPHDRHRARRSGHALVRGHGHRSRSAYRRDADARCARMRSSAQRA